MRILFVASEITPIAKIGGLGDVVGALPKALAENGIEVIIVTGYYGTHQEKKYPTKEITKSSLWWGGNNILYSVRQGELPESKVKIYYIVEPGIVGSGEVYGNPTAFATRQVETERFLFISKAAALLPKLIGFNPDLWHLHDWHAAAVTSFLPPNHAPTLLTIHNLANQGWAQPETAKKAGLENKGNQPVNIFGLGLKQADWLSTVSPTYALEIQAKPEGEGFENILKTRSERLVGITNGIDTDFFNPESDEFLAARLKDDINYFKRQNRQVLNKELNLKGDSTPLFGVVSRLTGQKGIELAVKAIEPCLKKHQAQFVCLGVGDPALEELVNNLAARYPGQAAGRFTFDERLAHVIYAAADFFLLPSRFEPCGLGQLIAMRYATVPVVRATGGLKDTVVDIKDKSGNGIVFIDYKVNALSKAITRALELYQDRAKLELVRRRGWARESSWGTAAKQYLEFYKKICASKPQN